jgi:hypothetical protein
MSDEADVACKILSDVLRIIDMGRSLGNSDSFTIETVEGYANALIDKWRPSNERIFTMRRGSSDEMPHEAPHEPELTAVDLTILPFEGEPLPYRDTERELAEAGLPNGNIF